MQLKNILNPPAYFRDREKSIRQVKIYNVQAKIEDNDLFIIGNINNHTTIIKLLNPKDIQISNNILIDCTCKSFKYEFAYPNKDDLLFPNNYLDRPPRERNIHRITGVCKHLHALARYIQTNRHKLINRLR